jgi:hypothetical protein
MEIKKAASAIGKNNKNSRSKLNAHTHTIIKLMINNFRNNNSS